MEPSGEKIAVLFPGVGYTCERPLLYYGGKLLEEAEYRVVRLFYHGFPTGIRGDKEKMKESFCCSMAEGLIIRWRRGMSCPCGL